MNFLSIYILYYFSNCLFKAIRVFEIYNRSFDERWIKAGFRMNLKTTNWEYMLNFNGIRSGKGVFENSYCSNVLQKHRVKKYLLRHLVLESLYDFYVFFNLHYYIWDYIRFNIHKERTVFPYLNEFNPKLNHVLDRRLKIERGSGYFYKYENLFSFIDFEKQSFVLNSLGDRKVYEYKVQGTKVLIRLIEQGQGVHENVAKAKNSMIAEVPFEIFTSSDFTDFDDSDQYTLGRKLCILANSPYECDYDLFRSYISEEIKRYSELGEKIKSLESSHGIFSKIISDDFWSFKRRGFYKKDSDEEKGIYYEEILKLIEGSYKQDDLMNYMNPHYFYYLCPMYNILSVDDNFNYKNYLALCNPFDENYFV